MNRIATAPISWGACEIPDWGEVLPFTRVLDEMAAAGYEGTELGPFGYLPTNPATLRRELEARGLALVGAFVPVALGPKADAVEGGPRAAASDALATALETTRILADLGAPVLVLADAGDPRRAQLAGRVPADGSASLSGDEWSRACETVNELARRARDLGLVTAFHPHIGTYVETPLEVARLLGGTDPTLVGFCLDTGHIAYGGGDPAALAHHYGSRVRHVHLKDLRREVHRRAVETGLDQRAAVGAGVFPPLGDGDLDLQATLATLRSAGYDGWLVVEQDVRLGVTPNAVPLEDARRSIDFVRSTLDYVAQLTQT